MNEKRILVNSFIARNANGDRDFLGHFGKKIVFDLKTVNYFVGN